MILFLYKKKCFDNFLASRNSSIYDGLSYGSECVKNVSYTYATTTAIRNEIMQFNNIEKVPRKTQVKCSSRLKVIAYSCGLAISLDNKTLIFFHALPSATQIITAHKTGRLDDGRRTSEKILLVAHSDFEADRARLTTRVFLRDDIYVRSSRDDTKELKITE